MLRIAALSLLFVHLCSAGEFVFIACTGLGFVIFVGACRT